MCPMDSSNRFTNEPFAFSESVVMVIAVSYGEFICFLYALIVHGVALNAIRLMKKKLMKNIVYKLSSSYMYDRLGYVMLDSLIKVVDN